MNKRSRPEHHIRRINSLGTQLASHQAFVADAQAHVKEMENASYLEIMDEEKPKTVSEAEARAFVLLRGEDPRSIEYRTWSELVASHGLEISQLKVGIAFHEAMLALWKEQQKNDRVGQLVLMAAAGARFDV